MSIAYWCPYCGSRETTVFFGFAISKTKWYNNILMCRACNYRIEFEEITEAI